LPPHRVPPAQRRGAGKIGWWSLGRPARRIPRKEDADPDLHCARFQRFAPARRR